MNLRKGSRGREVAKVQRLLKITDDGIFGEETESMVLKFQKINELEVDGIVDNMTYSMLVKKQTVFPLMNKLDGHIPSKVSFQLPKTMETFEITTSLRLSHFLSQCSHESGGFKYVEENLNYSSDALLRVFSKYFTKEEANEFHRQPERIANRVYSNRMGNGDEESGDGWRFRGRGYIQCTGRYTYEKFNKYVPMDVVETPDLVKKKYSLVSAGWFWFTNNLNDIADKGSDVETITRVTRRINGGTNGLNHRIEEFNRFFTILQ